MRLFFARHGESEANRLNEISNRGLKHGLTANGRSHAAALAETLRGAQIAHIYTSPLLRAVQSAEILSAALGVPYTTTDALREYDCGVLEGRSDAEAWWIYGEVLEAWVRRGDLERRPEGGESFLDMRRRFVPFIEALVRERRASQAGVVLIGHGGLYRCMLPEILANVSLDFTMSHPIGYSATVVAEPRDEGLICTSWCGERALALGM